MNGFIGIEPNTSVGSSLHDLNSMSIYEPVNYHNRLNEFMVEQIEKLKDLTNVNLRNAYKTLSINNFNNSNFNKLLETIELNANIKLLAEDYLKELMEVFYCAIGNFINIALNKMSNAINSLNLLKIKNIESFAINPQTSHREEKSIMADILQWAADRDGYPIFDRDGVQLVDVVDERTKRVIETIHPEETRMNRREWRTERDYDDRGNFLGDRNGGGGRRDSRSERGSGRYNDDRGRDSRDSRDSRGRSFGSNRNGGDSDSVANRSSMYDDNREDDKRTTVYSSAINNSNVRQTKTVETTTVSGNTRNTPTSSAVNVAQTTQPQAGGDWSMRDVAGWPYPIIYRPTDGVTVIGEDGNIIYEKRSGDFNKVDYLQHELNSNLRNASIAASQIRNFGNTTSTIEVNTISKSSIDAITKLSEQDSLEQKYNFNWITLSDYDAVDLTQADSLEHCRKQLFNGLAHTRDLLPGNIDNKAAMVGHFNVTESFLVDPEMVIHCKRLVEDLDACSTFSGLADCLKSFTKRIDGTPPVWWHSINKYFTGLANNLVRYGLAIDGKVNYYHLFGEDFLSTVEKFLGSKKSEYIADHQTAFIKGWNSDEGFGKIVFDADSKTLSIFKYVTGIAVSESLVELNLNYYGRNDGENYGLVDYVRLPGLAEKLGTLMSDFNGNVTNRVAAILTVPVVIFTSDERMVSLHKGHLIEDAVIMAFD